MSSAISAEFQATLGTDVTALLLYVEEVRTAGLVTLTIGDPVLKTGSAFVSAPGWVEFALTGPPPLTSRALRVLVSSSTADLTLRHLQVHWFEFHFLSVTGGQMTRLMPSGIDWLSTTGVFRLATGSDPLADPACGAVGAVSGSPYVFEEWVALDGGSEEQLVLTLVGHPGPMGLDRITSEWRGDLDWRLVVSDGGSYPIGADGGSFSIGVTVKAHPAFVPDTWPRPGISPLFRVIASGSGAWRMVNPGPGLDVCHPAVRASFGGQRARAVGAPPGSDFVLTTSLRRADFVCRNADRDSHGSTDCQFIVDFDQEWSWNTGDCDDTDARINPGAPEICDALDNDCNALVDGADLQLVLPPCSNQAGVCFSSRQTPSTCVNGAFLACTNESFGPRFGQSEALCGSEDFNCDGTFSRAIPCPRQLGVCLGVTHTDCTAGAGCGLNEYGPDFELTETRCDGLDNDCDGNADDVPMKPCALQLGVCADATTTQDLCQSTGWTECGADQYGAGYEPFERSCDNLDNDCDGSTDEGCVGAPTPAPGCGCGAIDSVLLLSSLLLVTRRRLNRQPA